MRNIGSPNEKIFGLVLQSLELLFENCSNIMMNYLESVANVLINLQGVAEVNIRYKIGRVWMSIIKFNSEVLHFLFENLFNFFIQNLKYEHYELNFNTCDFFNFLLQDNGALLKNEKINALLNNNLSM